ncbi:DNA-processing protein DprA [candidate division KSB1 bacterium]|nr:DNA-processing protein DprA [candidate division KSB1 bacterium]
METPQQIKIDPGDLLRLSVIPGIGSKKIRTLIARFKTPSNVFKASYRELLQIEGVSKLLVTNIKKFRNDDFVSRQLQLLTKNKTRILSYWDNEYPVLLKKIEDPPVILYINGEIRHNDKKSIAIVGTRNPSTYGKLVTERFARELALKDFTIVSGLARGVDTIAHNAVLSVGGNTVAVLGSGVDVIYPSENQKLSETITGSGAVISEFPMGTKPEAVYFPRRNRIIAGMCLATLVIEAGKKSGALITADRALEQGRDVFAVPGNINNPKSAGCNELIQQGAKLVRSIDDILEEFSFSTEKPKNIAEQLSHIPLSKHEEKIFNLLSNEPLHIDQISEQGGLPISQVLSVLLSLELKNLVKQMVGKNFIRAL